MSTVHGVLENIQSHLRARLAKAEAKQISIIEGTFDFSGIKNRSFVAPAIFLSAIAGVPTQQANQAGDMDVIFGAYVIVKDAGGASKRVKKGLALTEKTVRSLSGQSFGVGKIKKLKWQNLADAEGDKQTNQVIYAITWTQGMLLNDDSDVMANLKDLLLVEIEDQRKRNTRIKTT